MATLKSEYKEMLMKMTPDDITASFIFKYLADRSVKENGKVKIIPSKIKTSDTFTLKAKEYTNDKEVLTNVGLFIYNKFLFEESLYKVVGYINEPVTADVQKGIESKLSGALLTDKITPQEFGTYLDKTQWLSMQFNSIFSSSFTMNTIKPNAKVMKKKEELIKKHKDDIESGNVTAAFNIEQELVKMAKEELKGDPGMNLYDSGARGSVSNNLKANTIIKGPVFNPSTNKWDFVSSNFTDGIKKEEIPTYGNSVVTGALTDSAHIIVI